MAPSRFYPFGLRVAVAVLCIFSVIFSPSKSGGVASSSYKEDLLQPKKVMLGSRPPACVDKCMKCKPCKATLVIPHHQKRSVYGRTKTSSSSSLSHREDGTYYLVSWKCSCGNKLFQP